MVPQKVLWNCFCSFCGIVKLRLLLFPYFIFSYLHSFVAFSYPWIISIHFFLSLFSHMNDWYQCFFVFLLVAYESRDFQSSLRSLPMLSFEVFLNQTSYPLIYAFYNDLRLFKQRLCSSFLLDDLVSRLFFLNKGILDNSFFFAWGNHGFRKKSCGCFTEKNRQSLVKTFRFNAVLKMKTL